VADALVAVAVDVPAAVAADHAAKQVTVNE
jgi:hypothetical protein